VWRGAQGEDRGQTQQDGALEECWCVVCEGEKLLLGLRDVNVANARCWGINPLSLEQEGRIQCWCARSLSIIGGKEETILGQTVEKGRHVGQT
jgi:hypothetical protein